MQIANVPVQTIQRRGAYVNLFKIGYYCDEPCKQCGGKANYEIQEPVGHFWSWCGYCDKGA